MVCDTWEVYRVEVYARVRRAVQVDGMSVRQKVEVRIQPEKIAVFDASKPLVVPILPGGEKKCEVRFPTDDEWCAWARSKARPPN